MSLSNHILGSGGGGGGVTGLTSATGGDAIADNEVIRGDGGTGIQGSIVTLSDAGVFESSGLTALLAGAGQTLYLRGGVTAGWQINQLGTLASSGGNGVITGVSRIDVDNITIDGNTISSTNANGDILLVPNGTGSVLAGVGTKTAVAIGLAADPDTGFYQRTTDRWTLSLGGAVVTEWTPSRMQLDADWQIGWQTIEASTSDTGIGRLSAGVVKVTDGTATSIRSLFGGGAAVASAAALPLPTGRVFHVTGTTAISSITSTNFQSGAVITLIFDDVINFRHLNNIKLEGSTDFGTVTDSLITLIYDGTNWHETGRKNP